MTAEEQAKKLFGYYYYYSKDRYVCIQSALIAVSLLIEEAQTIDRLRYWKAVELELKNNL